MIENNWNISLGEAASHFLTSLPPEKRAIDQQGVYRFVRWYGWERPLAGLTAPEIANYAERLSLSDIDYAKKLEIIRAFLVYVKKADWTQTNLAIHLKPKRTKNQSSSSARAGLPRTTQMTREGYAKLEAKLAELKGKRSQLIEEMRRAAADKDFSENAPLDAAREQRGHIEGQIQELEEALKSSTVISAEREISYKVGIGDSVVLSDLTTGEELTYIIVAPKEVDPTKGKISSASPIGKAVIGRGHGEIVAVNAPLGKLRYQIKKIHNLAT